MQVFKEYLLSEKLRGRAQLWEFYLALPGMWTHVKMAQWRGRAWTLQSSYAPDVSWTSQGRQGWGRVPLHKRGH